MGQPLLRLSRLQSHRQGCLQRLSHLSNGCSQLLKPSCGLAAGTMGSKRILLHQNHGALGVNLLCAACLAV